MLEVTNFMRVVNRFKTNFYLLYLFEFAAEIRKTKYLPQLKSFCCNKFYGTIQNMNGITYNETVSAKLFSYVFKCLA